VAAHLHEGFEEVSTIASHDEEEKHLTLHEEAALGN
jgi:hypothetical protein